MRMVFFNAFGSLLNTVLKFIKIEKCFPCKDGARARGRSEQCVTHCVHVGGASGLRLFLVGVRRGVASFFTLASQGARACVFVWCMQICHSLARYFLFLFCFMYKKLSRTKGGT